MISRACGNPVIFILVAALLLSGAKNHYTKNIFVFTNLEPGGRLDGS